MKEKKEKESGSTNRIASEKKEEGILIVGNTALVCGKFYFL